jgi:hypothetical protein
MKDARFSFLKLSVLTAAMRDVRLLRWELSVLTAAMEDARLRCRRDATKAGERVWIVR